MNDRASGFLERATFSIEDVRVCSERLLTEAEPRELIRNWILFLGEFRKSIRFLEQAGRNIGNNSWAESLSSEIRSNSILNYVFHARNADGYGAELGYVSVPASLEIGGSFGFQGKFSRIKIEDCYEGSFVPDGSLSMKRIDGQFSVSDGRLVQGWLSSQVPVRRQRPFIRLLPVSSRGRDYHPPILDASLENLAGQISCSCFHWLNAKLGEAKEMKGKD